MLYAKIVLGLAVEGPFDYIVPSSLARQIKVGSRVKINFCNREAIGYVVGLSGKTSIRKLKTIFELLDTYPILSKNMLLLTKNLSDYYCCSWGEAIETALPGVLRKGRRVSELVSKPFPANSDKPEALLLHDLDEKERWEVYLARLSNVVSFGRQAIILAPDIAAVFKAREKISAFLGVRTAILYRKQPKELQEWISIKEGKVNIVVGTRSAIFSPFENLGLMIIDEEQDTVYKQDQVPHYHAREIAFMRSSIENASLILGASSPSLESFYLAKEKKIKYAFIPRKRIFPEVRIAHPPIPDRVLKQRNIFSKYLTDCIAEALNVKGRILLFLNRRGFAAYSSCMNCQKVIKCPRCSVNLAYHFKEDALKCRYCNFKMLSQRVCPYCNSGYLRYHEAGIEKIESELSRIFPQARIKLLDKKEAADTANADILVSTELIIRQGAPSFDLVGVISIDNCLNRIDFRSGEKTFALLAGLLRITDKKIVIQSALNNHHCFLALENRDVSVFYEKELSQRSEPGFPPYKHFVLVKLRGEKENSVKEAAESLFDTLGKLNKNKNISLLGVNRAWPEKLRGKYCWQILFKTNSCEKLSCFLKNSLKGFPRSGIKVTVDVDPA